MTIVFIATVYNATGVSYKCKYVAGLSDFSLFVCVYTCTWSHSCFISVPEKIQLTVSFPAW